MLDWRVLLVTLAAGELKGTAGFGFGLFSMGILTTMMPVADAVVLLAVLTLGSSAINLWTVRTSVPWRETLPVVLSALPASLLGVALLESLDAETLRTGVAAMILAGCAVALWTPARPLLDRPLPGAYIAGGVSGVFGGALNMGGPPIVLYSLLRGWQKAEIKGLMSAFFVTTGLLRLILYTATQIAKPAAIRQAIVMIAPAMLAVYVGTRVFARMDDRIFRYAVTGLLALLAARILAT